VQIDDGTAQKIVVFEVVERHSKVLATRSNRATDGTSINDNSKTSTSDEALILSSTK
jgi:hypothetical protein